MRKLNVILISTKGNEVGEAAIEVDEFFTLGGSVIWGDRYFKASFTYGPEPDPFPLSEGTPAPILLRDDQVRSTSLAKRDAD